MASLSDVNQLFQTNVTGADAFGALSAGVSGTADLTPNVTADTNLADLNGGQGVSKGSIVVSDGIALEHDRSERRGHRRRRGQA